MKHAHFSTRSRALLIAAMLVVLSPYIITAIVELLNIGYYKNYPTTTMIFLVLYWGMLTLCVMGYVIQGHLAWVLACIIPLELIYSTLKYTLERSGETSKLYSFSGTLENCSKNAEFTCNDVLLGKEPVFMLADDFKKKVKPYETPPTQTCLFLPDGKEPFDSEKSYGNVWFRYFPCDYFGYEKGDTYRATPVLKLIKSSHYWWSITRDGCTGYISRMPYSMLPYRNYVNSPTNHFCVRYPGNEKRVELMIRWLQQHNDTPDKAWMDYAVAHLDGLFELLYGRALANPTISTVLDQIISTRYSIHDNMSREEVEAFWRNILNNTGWKGMLEEFSPELMAIRLMGKQSASYLMPLFLKKSSPFYQEPHYFPSRNPYDNTMRLCRDGLIQEGIKYLPIEGMENYFFYHTSHIETYAYYLAQYQTPEAERLITEYATNWGHGNYYSPYKRIHERIDDLTESVIGKKKQFNSQLDRQYIGFRNPHLESVLRKFFFAGRDDLFIDSRVEHPVDSADDVAEWLISDRNIPPEKSIIALCKTPSARAATFIDQLLNTYSDEEYAKWQTVESKVPQYYGRLPKTFPVLHRTDMRKKIFSCLMQKKNSYFEEFLLRSYDQLSTQKDRDEYIYPLLNSPILFRSHDQLSKQKDVDEYIYPLLNSLILCDSEKTRQRLRQKVEQREIVPGTTVSIQQYLVDSLSTPSRLDEVLPSWTSFFASLNERSQRVKALEALIRTNTPEAVDVIQTWSTDADPDVAQAARATLDTINRMDTQLQELLVGTITPDELVTLPTTQYRWNGAGYVAAPSS